MTNIVKLESKNDVHEVLANAVEIEKELDGVIVLGLKKDSSQLLLTSTMNAYEKSFLCQFLNAWMCKWFKLEVE